MLITQHLITNLLAIDLFLYLIVTGSFCCQGEGNNTIWHCEPCPTQHGGFCSKRWWCPERRDSITGSCPSSPGCSKHSDCDEGAPGAMTAMDFQLLDSLDPRDLGQLLTKYLGLSMSFVKFREALSPPRTAEDFCESCDLCLQFQASAWAFREVVSQLSEVCLRLSGPSGPVSPALPA